MSHKDLDPMQQLVDVDWDTPELQELLRKTAHLHLDKRNLVNKRTVRLRQSWQTSAASRPAIWVDTGQDDAQRVLLTQYVVEPGDPVMLEIRRPDRTEFVYAEVLSCRKGQRIGDDGIWVLIVRDLKRRPG
ncbi:MAG: hypothetical protein PHO64_09935 [Thiomonas sp.]|nr:hypothetical protein [Thiomonas sp.]